MCGRFVGNFSTDQLRAEIENAALSLGLTLDFPTSPVGLVSNFNTAPTQAIPVLRVEDNRLLIDGMRWGLVPRWAKDASMSSNMINARSETITEKPSFKNLVAHHRCIIPMNGFYEWDRSDPKRKIPYYVVRSDGHLMLGAGLWTSSPALDNMHTCALVTRESREDLAAIHNRSPVEFDADAALEWLMASPAPLELMEAEQPVFTTRRVATLVNSIRNNGPELIQPYEESESGSVLEDSSPEHPTLF